MALVPDVAVYALLEVFVFLAVAELLRSIGEKLKVPDIVVYLLLGMFLSSFALGGVINSATGIPIFTANSYALVFADFSVILLLFYAGLESGFQGLRAAGLPATCAAVAGDLVPFGIALAVLVHFYPLSVSLLLAVAAAPTSAAVVAALRDQARVGGTTGGQLLMNTAALDDIVALLLFSVVIELIGGPIDVVRLAGGFVGALVLLLAILFGSVLLVPRLLARPGFRTAEGMPFLLLFLIVAAVVGIGFSAVTGAYIAGIAVAESVVAARIRLRTEVLLLLFGALFFVITGSQFDFHQLGNLGVVAIGLLVAAIAAIGKVVGVYPFARHRTRSAAAARAVAVGMIPRGEIALVVGSVGFAAGILDEGTLGVLLLLSIATTAVGATLFRRWAPSLAEGESPPLPPPSSTAVAQA